MKQSDTKIGKKKLIKNMTEFYLQNSRAILEF